MVGCSAVGCTNASVKGKKMFRFPWNEARKLQWAVAMKRGLVDGAVWMPGVGARLCQDHFVTGAPNKDPLHIDYTPSLFWHDVRATETSRRRIECHERHAAIKKKRVDAPSSQLTHPNPSSDEETLPSLDASSFDTSASAAEHQNGGWEGQPSDVEDKRTVEVQTDRCEAPPSGSGNVDRIRLLEGQLRHLQGRVRSLQQAKSVRVMDDDKVRFYTGLSQPLFFAILENIAPVLPKAKRAFPHETQLLAFLMKLRINLPFKDLGYRFGVTRKTVSRSFRMLLQAVHHLCKGLVVFSSQEICRSWLTEKESKNFPHLRTIIDCTEVRLARPLNLDGQQVVWSHYKQATTLKYLVAVNPHGAVMFISKAYAGRASDKQLTLACGFMDLLEAGDQVLADRGFLLFEEFLERNCQLITPSFTKNRVQLPGQEVTTSRRISSSRIIVERAIGHLKKWRIMTDTVHTAVVDVYDEVIAVVAGLANLSAPLSRRGVALPTRTATQLEPDPDH